MQRKPVQYAVIALCLSTTVLCCVLAFEVLRLHSQIDAVVGHTDDTLESIRLATKNANDSWNDLYFDVKSSVESSAVASRSTAEMITDLHAGLIGGKDTHGNVQNALLPQAQDIVGRLADTTSSIQQDVHGLASNSKQALQPLNAALSNLSDLTQQLNISVASSTPKVQKSLDDLDHSLVDLDKVIADPNIAKTVADVQLSAIHVASTTQSVDMALQPFRKKGGFWKKLWRAF
jgi:hypothetical protein